MGSLLVLVGASEREREKGGMDVRGTVEGRRGEGLALKRRYAS